MNNITLTNVQNVRQMILEKECLDKPFIPTIQNVTGIITDQDHFPYTRWFRGRYYCDKPIVAEREAGYRTRHDYCYETNKCCTSIHNKPEICFQSPCSVVFPCNPCINNPQKIGLYSNTSCINLYR